MRVDICDLAKQPQKYSRQWVEVRGTVDLAFEKFGLHTRDCSGELRGIWLLYGGDEPTPTTSFMYDRIRPPGMVLNVGGIPVPLQHDSNLDLFRGRLVARRTAAPDGSPCHDACYLYRVTATFIGLFMAAPAGKSEWVQGYGHMGCCHLLTIRQVKDVEAERTPIPAGGTFVCSKDHWEMNQAEAEEALRHRPCTNLADCGKAVSEHFDAVAAHWNDKFVASQGTAHRFLEGAPEWISADLLTSYAVSARYSRKKHETNNVVGATVTRTTCKVVTAPFPQVALIRCRILFSDFDVRSRKQPRIGNAASPEEGWDGTPETSARPALEKAAKLWGIDLLPNLTLSDCEKPRIADGNQVSSCSWSEPTSMQGFTVQVSRSRPLRQFRGWDGIPWKLAYGYGLACIREGQ